MKKKFILLLAGGAVIALLAFLLLKKRAEEYFVLKRTDVDYKILASCTVSFPEPYDMEAKTEGDVRSIPVAEGQAVKKGTLLIQVDDFKERQNLTIAQNNYENARLKLVNSKEETYPRFKEQLNDAQAALTDAKNHAERTRALYAGGAVSRVDFENAQTTLAAAQARFNQAQLQLDSFAKSGAAAELINQLKILNARLELAKRDVEEKRFVAPYGCIVVKIAVKEGETVTRGKKAITILEAQPWVLETNVDQKELGFLENGLPCIVVFDAFPGERIKAHISLVCATIDFAKGTCNLKLQIDENKAFIKHGMTGSVEISGRNVRGLNRDVLALPANYVLHEQEGDFVLVQKGKNIEKTKVEIVAIGERWLSIMNLPEGTRIARPR